MLLLGPLLLLLLLLLEYLAFSDQWYQSQWDVKCPDVLYTWEGACVWIPCSFVISGSGKTLTNLTLYQNVSYDNANKEYTGNILYKGGVAPESKGSSRLRLLEGHAQFLGNIKNNCTFRIQPVEAWHSGLLGLRMVTEGDKWLHELHLNVSKTAPPPYIQLPDDIQEFEEVTLTCSLNFACYGYPIQLHWSLEGTVVTSITMDTKSVLTQSTLQFKPLWTHHGQNLTCSLRHPNEEQPLSEKTVQLNVKHKPQLQIEVSPQDAIVTEGQSVTMTCQVLSSNPQNYALFWLKDGVSLGQPTLTLPTVTKAMSGRYQCEAINELGPGRSKEVNLQVHYAPETSRVKIEPSPAREGALVTLTCLSRANPPPTKYTWYHNNLEMSETTEAFQIPGALLGHAGKYACLAENRLGRGQVGQEAELDVQYPPKEVTLVIKNPAQIREGDDVTLSCHHNSSNPKATRYEWNLGVSQMQSESPELRIQNVAWDASPVACAACNKWCSWGPLTQLDVQYAPRGVEVKSTSGFKVRSRQQVSLNCVFASSRPPAHHFFWKKNGMLLNEGRQLNFDSITPEDAGSYRCLVNNSVGATLSQALELQVEYAPRNLRVSISPEDRVVEGKKAILTCESDANPPVSSYAWFNWNNEKLQHSDQTLRLEPVDVQHSGAYWCQGTNRLGEGRSPSSILTVYYSPETISKRAILGVGLCLVAVILVIWGVKVQRRRKRIQSQQGIQANASAQSFFVRNKKVRRAPPDESPHSLGCYNPVMEEAISYAVLHFPDTPRIGNAEASESQGPSPGWEDTVTYSVVQKRPVGDYENVSPDAPEDEGIHYSELVHFGVGERTPARESVDYVTLKQ